MTTYEQIKLEGKRDTAAAIFGRMIAKRFRADPDSLMPLLKELDLDQYEQLSDKILEAGSMEEILHWLQTGGRN